MSSVHIVERDGRWHVELRVIGFDGVERFAVVDRCRSVAAARRSAAAIARAVDADVPD